MSSRTMSVFPDTPASEVMEWLQRVWATLTPEEREHATMEARPVKDMVMVGYRWGRQL